VDAAAACPDEAALALQQQRQQQHRQLQQFMRLAHWDHLFSFQMLPLLRMPLLLQMLLVRLLLTLTRAWYVVGAQAG
jgi:hypothetical protein